MIHTEFVINATPMYATVAATYNGLREKRYGPIVTNASVGNAGLGLVLAVAIALRPQNERLLPRITKLHPSKRGMPNGTIPIGTIHCSNKPIPSATR